MMTLFHDPLNSHSQLGLDFVFQSVFMLHEASVQPANWNDAMGGLGDFSGGRGHSGQTNMRRYQRLSLE